MKFEVFLEQVLNEAPMTPHAKVESAIRSLSLKYKIDKSDKDCAFHLEHGYTLISVNGGDINLTKVSEKKPIATIKAHEVIDSTKIVGKVEEMLKANAPELFGSDKTKDKLKDAA